MQLDNFRSLALSKHPLLVRCRSCNHRSTIAADQLGADAHSMNSIEEPRLKYSMCGGHDIERRITYGAPSVDEWLGQDGLSGGPLPRPG
jgi:hypothetical protein